MRLSSPTRPGETIGPQRDLLLPTLINVEWQLREIRGRFFRLPPKDDSYRSTNWEPLVPADLPAFLAELLAAQAENAPGSGAAAPASTAARAGTCSTAPTVVITAAATSPDACSVRLRRAVRAGGRQARQPGRGGRDSVARKPPDRVPGHAVGITCSPAHLSQPRETCGEDDLPNSSQYGDSSHPSGGMRAVHGAFDLELHLWAILGSNQ